MLTTIAISSFLIMSTMCGRPSATLLTGVTATPAAASAAAVPRVATIWKPRPSSIRAVSIARGLSLFFRLTNTLPAFGSRTPAASWLLRNASPKVSPTPITSPVDFISGPRIVSTPGNLMNGNTASFTEKYGGTISPSTPCASSEMPAMQRAAIFASGRPVAFET